MSVRGIDVLFGLVAPLVAALCELRAEGRQPISSKVPMFYPATSAECPLWSHNLGRHSLAHSEALFQHTQEHLKGYPGLVEPRASRKSFPSGMHGYASTRFLSWQQLSCQQADNLPPGSSKRAPEPSATSNLVRNESPVQVSILNQHTPGFPSLKPHQAGSGLRLENGRNGSNVRACRAAFRFSYQH